MAISLITSRSWLFLLTFLAATIGLSCGSPGSPPPCGDGVWNNAIEECDDHNQANGDGCSSECKIEEGWACANPLNLNTGSGVGQAATVGAKDAIWSWSDTAAGASSPATVAGNCAPGAWNSPPSFGSWVNRYGCNQNSPPDHDTFYKATFTLASAAAASSTSFAGTIWADNAVTDVLVNGTVTGFRTADPAFNGAGISFGSWPSTLYKGGTNTLTVVVHNAAGGISNPDGLLVVAVDPKSTTSRCVKACGDSVVEAGEDCDDGAANGMPGKCSAECKVVSTCDGGGCDGGVDAPTDAGDAPGSDGDAASDRRTAPDATGGDTANEPDATGGDTANEVAAPDGSGGDASNDAQGADAPGDGAGPGSDAGQDGGACTTLFGAAASPTSLGTDDTSVALADLDHDGFQDAIVVARFNNAVSVLLGKGDGTFQPRVNYPTAQNPIGVAVGDLNGDGWADLVVTSSPSSGTGSVGVRLNLKNGALGARADFPVGQGPSAVAIADLDGNSRSDVVVANATANTVGVLLGDGQGALGSQTEYATGASPTAVAVADVDKNGKADVLVLNQIASSVSVLLGNGNGTLQAKVDTATDTSPVAFDVADVDGDTFADVVVANATNTVNPSVLSVLIGKHDGSFTKTSIPTARFPNGIRLADVDRNGTLDIVCGASGADQVAVHRGFGNGTFAPAETFATGDGAGPAALVVGNLNAGTKPDVFVILSAVDQATVLLNTCP
jgi:cysteine-rich repeat protein